MEIIAVMKAIKLSRLHSWKHIWLQIKWATCPRAYATFHQRQRKSVYKFVWQTWNTSPYIRSKNIQQGVSSFISHQMQFEIHVSICSRKNNTKSAPLRNCWQVKMAPHRTLCSSSLSRGKYPVLSPRVLFASDLIWNCSTILRNIWQQLGTLEKIRR